MISSTKEKSRDCSPYTHDRRFTEVNSNKNDRNNNKESSVKSELQAHHSWANERDTEPIDWKMPSQSAKSTTNIRSINPDLPPPVLPKRIRVTSHTNPSAEESSSDPLINYMSINKVTVTKESHISSSVSTHNTVTVDTKKDPDDFVRSVLQKGDYLKKYGRWHKFRGAEEIKKCSNKVIERNENIWEIVYNEYKYVEMLINIRNVYCHSYPHISIGSYQHSTVRGSLLSSSTRSELTESSRVMSSSESKDHSGNLFESIDTILPGIDRMIECHARICNVLIDNHLIRPDRVITEIGRVLHESIPDDFIPVLSELYGSINFAKVHVNEKLTMFKKYPEFYSYITKCENDPRMDKKKLSDLLLVMSTHLSKTVTTVMSIINNTINDSKDLNNLTTFKDKVDKIINGASSSMDCMMNTNWLKSVIENYETNPYVEDSERALKYMTATNAKILFNGKVNFEIKKNSNGRPLTRELYGVALEECMFFLQVIQEPNRSQPKYQLFKDRDSSFPALLRWGELYGYFREDDTKCNDSYYFYVIIEKPNPAMVHLSVGPLADRSYWKQYMMQGFSRWQSESSDITEAENKLSDDLRKIKQKWLNTQFGIELIKDLDNSLRVLLEYRTVGFRCLLEEELKRMTVGHLVDRCDYTGDNSFTITAGNEPMKEGLDATDSACMETFLPDLSTEEGVNDWLQLFIEWINRLKFSLCSSGGNITRSASEIEARKRPSIPTVKKCDTFSSRDSTNNEKRPADVTFLNPTITKQKKDQRRISVSGFTNLFRINSKTVKHDESDKVILPESTADTDEKDSTLEKMVMLSEADCFLMGLSKDTVMAFNEINVAAKNITNELLDVRSKNLRLEAELKSIQEENQSFCEFQKKYQKSVDNQAALTGNKVNQKSDSSHLALFGSNGMGNFDPISEGTESLGDNSAGNAHINQKFMALQRQTEHLREMYRQFENEKKKWEKEYDAQRIKNRSDQESNFQKSCQLTKEKEALEEKEKKYLEKCLLMQEIIDMHQIKNAVKFDFDTLNIPTPIPNSDHTRSRIDEAGSKKTSKTIVNKVKPPIAYTEASSFNADQSRRADPMRHSNVPAQLSGSLINQERQSLQSNSSEDLINIRDNSSSRSAQLSKRNPTKNLKDTQYSNTNSSYKCDDAEDDDMPSNADNNHSSSDRVTKTTSLSDTSKQGNRTSVMLPRATSDGAAKAPEVLKIPLGLASKSKPMKKK